MQHCVFGVRDSGDRVTSHRAHNPHQPCKIIPSIRKSEKRAFCPNPNTLKLSANCRTQVRFSWDGVWGGPQQLQLLGFGAERVLSQPDSGPGLLSFRLLDPIQVLAQSPRPLLWTLLLAHLCLVFLRMAGPPTRSMPIRPSSHDFACPLRSRSILD